MAITEPLTFLFHDYETGGVDPKRDRPLQFAAIRTDEHFNIIEEPIMLYAKICDDYIPHPKACLITGITPQKTLEEGLCEAEFITRIHAEMARPGTCALGYNSIRFDDEVTRNTLYRNFFDPYAREWQNNCSRWDIIDSLRLARALRPDGIIWPTYADGSPSLRLEDLTQANGIGHDQAHDALSDVYATIAMAKLLKEKQPRLFDFVFQNRSKQTVQKSLDVANMKPFLHVSSRYSASLGNLAIVAPLAYHPIQSNAVITWDLRCDPTPLLDLDVHELHRLLYAPREASEEREIGLKLVHLNKCPIVAPAGMLNAEEAQRYGIEGAVCRRHLSILRQATQIQSKLKALYEINTFVPEKDPDHMLYSGGFFSPHDRHLMDKIRQFSADELIGLQLPFQDPRLEEMLLRYKARNYPYTLDSNEQQRWEEHRSQRLLGPENEGCLTLTQAFDEMNRIATETELSERDMSILEDLASYIESVYPMEF